ncbi:MULTISPECIES: GbsR/MarR family transcriptional regulator [Rhodococcus]|uniref:GbsR/MarR family transcriptional regulator n=1 Tax=Rhodococcus globerulus TaxID=33008 RepID=UPI001C561BF2|nr:MarR family transcriptional regulator [Rhodococcus globerulus]QXW03606.1 MarR family transcriptional regulator [Rhodococcus globerulus]
MGDVSPARGGDFSAWFIDQFATYWQSGGGARIEGRIAGYLLISESPGVSAEELAIALDTSRGSVSNYIRRLIDRGFVKLVRKPRDRTHYYVMDSDVWGGFLENEHQYLENQRTLATEALQYANPNGPAYIRVLNMRDYMGWIIDNRMLGSEWARFKEVRDGAVRDGPVRDEAGQDRAGPAPE